MSFNDYMAYKKKQESASKFTLKPPKGLTEQEAMYIVTTISQLAQNSPLPQDKEFKKLSQDAKRYILAAQFAKGEHVFKWAESLFKRYVVNANVYPAYPSVPYSHNVPHNRETIFKKARSYANGYYIFRHSTATQNINFGTQNPYNTPIIYLDESKDWFKELITLPKQQLFYPDEAKDVKQIANEYRTIAYNSCFTHQFKDKVFFFPVECKDSSGRYYSFLKQVEITKKPGMDGYMLSISLSAIPKNNAKYCHQLLRIDSGGYHKNAHPQDIEPTLKTSKVYTPSTKNKVKELRNPNSEVFVPTETMGFHFHLFSNESNFIYSKNPNTADAMGIEDILNMWKNLDYFRAQDIHPCLEQILSSENADRIYPKLQELYVMNNNLKEGKIDTTNVRNFLNGKNIQMLDSHIESASHFLYALEILEKMDEIVDIFLNINCNPVAINDEEYLSILNSKPQQKTSIEATSNRKLEEILSSTAQTTENASKEPSQIINDDDDVM